MNSNLTFDNYFFFERLGKEIHAIDCTYGFCVYCNKFIGSLNHGNSVLIIKNGPNISYRIPYCSEKCKTEDPNSVEFIKNYVSLCDSFKPRFKKQEEYEKQRNDTRKENELIIKTKNKKILFIQSSVLVLIILAGLYLIDGMNIIGYFFGLLLFLIIRSLLKK
jgi:hypothetical protein